MTLILLALWGTSMVCLARLICGNWLNHLSVYTGVWTLALCAYAIRLVRYNTISMEAWLYIFTAWVAVYLGTVVGMAGRGRSLRRLTTCQQLRRLKTAIILLSLGGAASCVVLARQIMEGVYPNLFVAVTLGAPKIYAAAFEETGQFVGIPYVGFLPFAASALAGAYAAWRGRVDWVCVFPLIIATLLGVLSVSRWAMLLAGALFLFALFLTPKQSPICLSSAQKLLLVVVCAGGVVLVTLSRNDLTSPLVGQSARLDRIADWVPVAPSVYFYLSGPPVGFSEYLKSASLEANLPWGRYTFASVYRFFSKLGLAPNVPFHQEFYNVPVPINGCTYLREIHSDFGVWGIFIFPFLLGLTAALLSLPGGSLVKVVLLAHLYVVVLFSCSNLVMTTGQWFQSVIVSFIASILVQRSVRLAEVRSVSGTSLRVSR